MTLMMRDLENQEMGAEKERKDKIAEMLRDGKTPQAAETREIIKNSRITNNPFPFFSVFDLFISTPFRPV